MFDKGEGTACSEGGEGVRMEEDEMDSESREEEALDPFIEESRSLLSPGDEDAEGVGEAEGGGRDQREESSAR